MKKLIAFLLLSTSIEQIAGINTDKIKMSKKVITAD
jgi:hypothetical protein